jgi:hypothetical protein
MCIIFFASVELKTNLGQQVAQMTKVCVVSPNICDSLVWNLLQVTILDPKILTWLLDFWKICELLVSSNYK